jgi:hypothetical protein
VRTLVPRGFPVVGMFVLEPVAELVPGPGVGEEGGEARLADPQHQPGELTPLDLVEGQVVTHPLRHVVLQTKIYFFLLSTVLYTRPVKKPMNRQVQPERLERGGPLLKLRRMGTQRVQIKWVLPWLVCWARRALTRDFCTALVALADPVQNIIFLTIRYFNSLVPIAQQARQQCCGSGSICFWASRIRIH